MRGRSRESAAETRLDRQRSTRVFNADNDYGEEGRRFDVDGDVAIAPRHRAQRLGGRRLVQGT